MNQIIDLLKKEFPSIGFHREAHQYGGELHTFYIRVETAKALEENWENIRNMIAVYFQTKLEIEFARWNLYLFFITPIPISRELKHRIEHDTVSSRKIIVDQHPQQKKKDFYKTLFSEHVSNANLDIKTPEQAVSVFSKDKLLAGLLDKLPSAKAKRTDDSFTKALHELEKKLSR